MISRNISYSADFYEPPTLPCIQRLFRQLYEQGRLNPRYLFAGTSEYEGLLRSIAECSSVSGPRVDAAGEAMPSGVPCIYNETTGYFVYLVALPGAMKPGNVAVGFFVD